VPQAAVCDGRPWGMSGACSRGQQGTTAVPSGQLCSSLDQRQRLGAAAFIRAYRPWHARGSGVQIPSAPPQVRGPVRLLTAHESPASGSKSAAICLCEANLVVRHAVDDAVVGRRRRRASEICRRARAP
jgi:hypothetical protein